LTGTESEALHELRFCHFFAGIIKIIFSRFNSLAISLVTHYSNSLVTHLHLYLQKTSKATATAAIASDQEQQQQP
jgi:hypothetical protein